MGTLKPPGSPGELRNGAERLKAAGQAAEDLAGQLRSSGSGVVESAAWVGEAADAFGYTIGVRAGELQRVGPAMKSAANAISGFAQRLEHAQTRIPKLEAEIDDLEDEKDDLGNDVDNGREIRGLEREIDELLLGLNEAASAASSTLDSLVPKPAPPVQILAPPGFMEWLGDYLRPDPATQAVLDGKEPAITPNVMIFAAIGAVSRFLTLKQLMSSGSAALQLPAGGFKDVVSATLFGRRLYEDPWKNFVAASAATTLLGVLVESFTVVTSWGLGVTVESLVKRGKPVPILLRDLEASFGVVRNPPKALAGKRLFSSMVFASSVMGVLVNAWNLARPAVPLAGPIGKDDKGDNIYSDNLNWALNGLYETTGKFGVSIGGPSGVLKYFQTGSPQKAVVSGLLTAAIMTVQSGAAWIQDNPAPHGVLRDYSLATGHKIDEIVRVYHSPAPGSVAENLDSAAYNSLVGVGTMLQDVIERNFDPEVMDQRFEAWRNDDRPNDILNILSAEQRAELDEIAARAETAWDRAFTIEEVNTFEDAVGSLAINSSSALNHLAQAGVNAFEGWAEPVMGRDIAWEPFDEAQARHMAEAEAAWSKAENAIAFINDSGADWDPGNNPVLNWASMVDHEFRAAEAQAQVWLEPYIGSGPPSEMTPQEQLDFHLREAAQSEARFKGWVEETDAQINATVSDWWNGMFPSSETQPSPAPLPPSEAPVTGTAVPTGTPVPADVTAVPAQDPAQSQVDPATSDPFPETTIPEQQPPAPVDQAQPPAAPAPVVHVVQPGETLRGIAATTLGDEMRWPEIYRANADQISHPDLIRPGQSFVIPVAPEAAPAR